MTSVVYTFMYISPPRGCIIIYMGLYRNIRVRNATRSRIAANDYGLNFWANLSLGVLIKLVLIKKNVYYSFSAFA